MWDALAQMLDTLADVAKHSWGATIRMLVLGLAAAIAFTAIVAIAL